MPTMQTLKKVYEACYRRTKGLVDVYLYLGSRTQRAIIREFDTTF